MSPAGTDTRAELLAAARRVIRRDGFAGVTVGAITREAGASLGLLNYHFGSKDQVLAEAFDEIARSELAEIEAIARRPDPPAERLAACLAVSDWGDRESWTLWLDAWGASGRVEALRVTLGFYADGWRACLAGVLDDGVRDGSWTCEDAAQSASLIVAMIDGIGLQAMLHPDEVTPETAAAWARRIVEAELGIALPAPGTASAGRPPAGIPAPFELRLAIRGRDLDAGGTVHPAAQLAYLEEGRRGWLGERLGRAPTGLGRVAIEFRAPLREDAGEVVVRCALRRAGRTSVVTEETITTAAGEVVAHGQATLGLEDDGGRPRLLAPREREALAR